MNLTFRQVKMTDSEDRAFVMDAWQKSYKHSPWAGIISNNLFSVVLDDVVTQLIKRGMQVVILESEDPETKIGFIAYELAAVPVIHYLYVKPLLRNMGLGKKLLKHLGVSREVGFLYTFRTPDCSKFRNAVHCPAIARRKNLEPVSKERPNAKY